MKKMITILSLTLIPVLSKAQIPQIQVDLLSMKSEVLDNFGMPDMVKDRVYPAFVYRYPENGTDITIQFYKNKVASIIYVFKGGPKLFRKYIKAIASLYSKVYDSGINEKNQSYYYWNERYRNIYLFYSKKNKRVFVSIISKILPH